MSPFFYIMIGIFGFAAGRFGAGWASWLLVDMNCGGLRVCQSCGKSVTARQRWVQLRPIKCECQFSSGWWPLISALGLSIVWVGFSWLLLGSPNCQGIHEVRPANPLAVSRLPFHLSLLFLLWTALVTDLLDYVIPDEIVYSGIAIALVGAFATGDLQIIHIWVNWDEAIVSVTGPYLPQWMKDHQHLHGLAWSLAGIAAGASVTWMIRWLSSSILGYPALGLGDVTLMAMIGAYMGWQPALIVLALAPLTGIVIGIVVRIVSGRSFVAYGPYLVCSAMIVLSTWRWLWQAPLELRIVFSHWPSIAGLVGGALATLVVLLGVLRLFRALPAERK